MVSRLGCTGMKLDGLCLTGFSSLMATTNGKHIHWCFGCMVPEAMEGTTCSRFLETKFQVRTFGLSQRIKRGIPRSSWSPKVNWGGALYRGITHSVPNC